MNVKTEPLAINMGPLHPSTHGVFRMLAVLDGEVIVDLEPVFGYLHRGIEKLAEEKTYKQVIPLTDRLDYVSSMSNNLVYVLAVEKLAGIEVPARAQYIRVIMAELQRIASHLMAIGTWANDLGTFFTPFMYMFREREKIIDLFEMVSGQRLLYNYLRFGGLSHDLPDEFLPAVRKLLKVMPGYLNEYEDLLKENEIVLTRSMGIGVLPEELAINASASGPVLRGSGVKWDIRKVDPYSLYQHFDFDIPTGIRGDSYDRYRVRLEEIRQSLHIIDQATQGLPDGEVKSKVPLNLRPPRGEAYSHIEAPRGELGCYVVSDGSTNPYRFHIRAPSLINLTCLKDMVTGLKIADAIVTFGSIDICMAEVDR